MEARNGAEREAWNAAERVRALAAAAPRSAPLPAAVVLERGSAGGSGPLLQAHHRPNDAPVAARASGDDGILRRAAAAPLEPAWATAFPTASEARGSRRGSAAPASDDGRCGPGAPAWGDAACGASGSRPSAPPSPCGPDRPSARGSPPAPVGGSSTNWVRTWARTNRPPPPTWRCSPPSGSAHPPPDLPRNQHHQYHYSPPPSDEDGG